MNKELVTVQDGEFSMVQPVMLNTERSDDNFVAQLTDQKNISFCSMVATTEEEKVNIFNAMNSAEKSIKECVNMELHIVDVFMEVVQCINEETGETKACPRTVLIDKDGVGYTAVSVGVFSSLKKLFQVFGVPTWKTPVIIIPKIISKGTKQITSLSVKAPTIKK